MVGHGPLDQPGGRLMGDTTTLFVLELYEILLETGNMTFVQSMWPSAKRAIEWCMKNANGDDMYGLPQYLTTTYDHFQFERHQAVTYNAHVYQAALSAAIKLAQAVQDVDAVQTLQASLAVSQEAVVDNRLWNSTSRFFRCHTDTIWQTYTKQSDVIGIQTFTHVIGFLSKGSDFKPPTRMSFAECKATCAAAKTCLGFTFESNDAEPSTTVLCYMKTAIHLTPISSMPNQVFTGILVQATDE